MKIPFSGIVAIVAALTLSACESRQRQAPIEDFASWTDIVPQKTLIQISPESGPVDLNSVLSNEADLRSALDNLFPVASNIDNLRERIEFIRGAKSGADRERFELLNGLGGIIAHAFLNAAEATLDEGGRFDPSKRVFEFVYGQIDEYAFNERAGTGRIVDTTYFTTVTVPLGIGPIISETESYRWTISVEEGGFSVVPKSSADPDDPFPGTLDFDEAMLDRIELLGFEYKLWAKGTAIAIDLIEFKGEGDPNYVAVPASDSRYRRTAENCIDMLFVNRPPAILGELRPPLYCLGRCENPMLINTGI